MTINSSPGRLIKQFSDLKSDLSRMDGSLTAWERDGNTYPGHTVDDDFVELAVDMDDATLSMSDRHPEEKELLEALKTDTLNLGYYAGLTNSMNQQRTTFGQGWHSALDPSIADSDQAMDVLVEDLESHDDSPPSSGKVMKQLSDVQSDLNRWDANFSQWENRNIYPSRSVSNDLMIVAGALYDARDAVRSLHPEETQILKNLQKGIIDVTGDSGSTRHMNNHGVTFGSGWSRSLDLAIASVDKAMELIAGE